MPFTELLDSEGRLVFWVTAQELLAAVLLAHHAGLTITEIHAHRSATDIDDSAWHREAHILLTATRLPGGDELDRPIAPTESEFKVMESLRKLLEQGGIGQRLDLLGLSGWNWSTLIPPGK